MASALAGIANAGALDDLKAGCAAAERNDYGAAIRLITQALDSSEPSDADRAAAYRCRGNSYGDSGDYARAIVDYGAAIHLGPDDEESHLNRGVAYLITGAYARATADFDVAVRLDPEDAVAYRSRAVGRFVTGQFKQAAADFAHGLRLDPVNTNGLLWLHLARAKAGTENPPGDASKTDLRWRPLIVRLYLGTTTPEQLHAAAAGSTAKTQAPGLCIAAFYSGEYELMQRQDAAAKMLFQDAVNVCPQQSDVHSGALAELKRIGG